VEPIRLLTIGLPNLLEGLVSNAFVKQGPLKNVGSYENLQQFFSHGTDSDPTVIFIESSNTDDCMDVLYKFPKTSLVSMQGSGKSFDLWKLVPQKLVLGEVSPEELVSKIVLYRE